MQLKLKPSQSGVRRRLVAASCALLGASASRAQQATVVDSDNPDGKGVVDSAIAYYHEKDRVSAIEPVVNVRWDAADGSSNSLSLVLDSLSGASPNGALPSILTQTFASPSGNSLSSSPQTYTTASGQRTSSTSAIYTTAPGHLPTDPRYSDKRLAIGASHQVPISRLARVRVGGSLSTEQDFLSIAANTAYARDFNEKNTTLSVGINDELDAVRPIGGAPVPGSDYSLFQKAGHKSKNGIGAQLGVTQVIGRRWITQLDLNVDRFHGYLNDPYKILSILDTAGNTTGYLNEIRPDERTRRSAYLENRWGGTRLSSGLSLRAMSDDWGVHSETIETNVKFRDGDDDRSIQPNFRWYRQSAARFYTPWLDASAGSYVQQASADQRLGAFHALTYGLKYAMKLSGDSGTEISLRLEYYRQLVDERRAAPPLLQGLDLYPALRAVNIQFGARFGY